MERVKIRTQAIANGKKIHAISNLCNAPKQREKKISVISAVAERQWESKWITHFSLTTNAEQKKNWTQTQNAEFVFSTIPEPNALLIFPVNFSHFRFWAAACVRFIDCVQSIRFMKWTTANKKFVLKCHIEGQSSHTLPHVQITTDRTMRSSSGKQKESKKKSCYTTSERNRKKCS